MGIYQAPTAFDLLEEAKWEMQGTRRAAEHYRIAAAEADPHTLPSGQRLLREVIPKLIVEITQLQLQGADALSTSGHGRAASWAWPIQLLPAKDMALITLVCGLDAVRDQGGSMSTVVTVSINIASAIRDELEYRRWVSEQVAANQIAKEEQNWEHRDVLAAFRTRYPGANRKVWGKWRRKIAAAREERWSKEVAVAVGAALISALCKAAPTRFEIGHRREGPRTTVFLKLSEATEELMMDIEARAAVGSPLLMPMIIPPIPWRYVP